MNQRLYGLCVGVWLLLALAGCRTRPRPTEVPLAVATPLPTATATARPPATPTPLPTVPAASPTPTVTPTPTATAVDMGSLRLSLTPFAEDLQQPVLATHAGDGSGRIFVLEKGGRVLTFGAEGGEPDVFLNISGRLETGGSEQGLLGLAFDPAFARNGYFYLHYTRQSDGAVVIARFTANTDHSAGDPNSETVLLTVNQPAANHNGGMIAFGPDGMLYIGLGDGGGASDEYDQAQDLGTVLGALLRIDVQGEQAVAPADNPFVQTPDARPEIWAYGLRNPWRFSFDRQTGDLWIGDVGQSDWEEINYQAADAGGGQNYGWPIREGAQCYNADDCATDGFVAPVAEYEHEQGCAVSGGYVYRGAAQPILQGIYLYGDYCTGRIWGLARQGDLWRSEELLVSDARISSFGETEAGELLVVDYSGAVYTMRAEAASD